LLIIVSQFFYTQNKTD